MHRRPPIFSILLKKINRIRSKANTVQNNLEKWSEWDWSRLGEEWSNNEEWKRSLIEHVLEPNIPLKSHILEIGPGAGRWTEFLAPRASRLILADLTPKCIEICKVRFQGMSHIEYFVNNGTDLSFIEDQSIDRIWSWDVFVHVMSEDIREYVRQFSRLLKPGGKAIIHHSKNGTSHRGWRSDMTAGKMQEYCDEARLLLAQQFETWDDGRMHIWPDLHAGEGPDIISIIERPY